MSNHHLRIILFLVVAISGNAIVLWIVLGKLYQCLHNLFSKIFKKIPPPKLISLLKLQMLSR